MCSLCMQLLILVCFRQLLANLWSRHAALQCSFNQTSLDLFIPYYTGSVTSDAIFDPAALSGAVVQVKYRFGSDGNAELAPRPIGLPRDLHEALPYLALYLELGNESSYKATHSKIKVTAPEPTAHGQFQALINEWLVATTKLATLRNDPRQTKAAIEKQKKEVEKKRLAMDLYNRYSVSVRGASPEVYGILKSVGIEKAFSTLLEVTMPSPADRNLMVRHMRPLERLGNKSAHTAWMKYFAKDTDDHMEGTEDEV
jgi:hypothetical protein